MKNNKKIVSFSFLLMSIFFFSSCSNKLTRDKAEQLITQKFNLPETITEKLRYGDVYYDVNPKLALENYLVEHKLITFLYIENVRRNMFWAERRYKLDLTQEGQKYVKTSTSNSDGNPIYLIKVADRVFGEITGIKEIEEGKRAEVEFTLKYANITPFGEAFSYQAQALSNELILPYYRDGETFNKTVMIAKYDDGWRIE